MDLKAIRARYGLGAALAVGLAGVALCEVAVPLASVHIQEQRAEERWGRWYDFHLAALTRAFGPPRRAGYDRFEYDDYEVLLLDDSLAIRMVVVPDMRPISAELHAALDFYSDAKRKYEAGKDLIYDESTGVLRLIVSRPLSTRDLPAVVRDTRDLADWWRREWLPELVDVAAGKRPPRARHVYRPGQDPESKLREAQAFIAEMEAKQGN